MRALCVHALLECHLVREHSRDGLAADPEHITRAMPAVPDLSAAPRPGHVSCTLSWVHQLDTAHVRLHVPWCAFQAKTHPAPPQWSHATASHCNLPSIPRRALPQAHPATFVPYLQPLADQVAAMWAAGQLREGERVLLWEGEWVRRAGRQGHALLCCGEGELPWMGGGGRVRLWH